MKEQITYNADEVMWQAPRLTQAPGRPYADVKRAMEDNDAQVSEEKSPSQKLEDTEKSKREGPRLELSLYLRELESDLKKKDISTWTEKEKEKADSKLKSLKKKVKKTLHKKEKLPLIQEADSYARYFRKDSLVKKLFKLSPNKPKTTEEVESLRKLWHNEYTSDEMKDPHLRESIEAAVSLGHKPNSKTITGESVQEVGKVDEVRKNAKLEDEERKVKAGEILEKLHEEEVKVEITEKERLEKEEALLKAHEVGREEEGKDGEKAGIYNYTLSQIRDKAKILKSAGYSEEERRALMEAGIVGDAPEPGDASGAADSEGGAPSREYFENLALWKMALGNAFPTDPEQKRQLEELIKSGALPPGAGRPEAAASHPISPQGGIPQDAILRAQRQERQATPREGWGTRDPGEESVIGDEDLELRDRTTGFASEATRNKKSHLRERVVEGQIETDLYGRKINCVEVLAREIMENEDLTDYQIGGDYELLTLKTDAAGNVMYFKKRDPRTGQELDEDDLDNPEVIFNPDNFLHWARHWMMYWHMEDADSQWDFGKLIGAKRDYGPVMLEQMINNEGRFFRSWTKELVDKKDENGNVVTHEDGTVVKEEINPVYHDLVTQLKKELWLFGASRDTDIKYRLLMGDDDKLPQTIQELFYGNTFTKTVWEGKSSLFHMMSLPQKFKENEGGDVKGDMNVGRAVNMAYETYYNLSDRESLVRLLGNDASILNGAEVKKRLDKLAVEQQIRKEGEVGGETYVDPKLLEGIEDDPTKLMDLINIYNNLGKPNRVVHAVRQLIRESISKKFLEKGIEIDKESMHYAETMAYTMARWTGAAARNDTAAVGYDAWTRVLVTDEYRKKQLEEQRGGSFGTPYTVNTMKQVGVDLFNGLQVQSMKDVSEVVGMENGHEHISTKKRAKSALEVLKEMEGAGSEEEYHKGVRQLVFSDNAMRGFANDHLARSFAVFRQLQGGEEINFDKFTHFDYLKGVTFDRKAFEEAVKENFFKPMRYGYSTYPQLDFGKMVRTEVKNREGKKEFKDVRIAEAMFGRAILDGLGHKYFVHGKEKIDIKADNWAEKINWEAVSDRRGRVDLWRQVALHRLAAQLYSHKDIHSTDPAYSWWYYNEIIESLENIPLEIAGDETDMRGSKATGNFFDHHNIEWLRKESRTEAWRLYRSAFINDTVKGAGEGIMATWKAFAQGVTKGLT